jgi:23S rRNA (uridine2552-2'-O)-methyltransferase
MREISDYWTRKAKKEGYPARSVYKLKEIEEKFGVIPRRGCILDVGAAPGSWTQFVLRLRRDTCRIVAVDLEPLAIETDRENLVFYRGDICGKDTLAFLADHGPYDAIISDAAPSTTGNRTVDTARCESLAGQALELARRFLRPGGSCVIKIFQGGGCGRILGGMKEIFSAVKTFKPRATRSESFETYFIGQNKKDVKPDAQTFSL